MAKKAKLSTRSRDARAASTVVEDLDLDVTDNIRTDHIDDDDVVHNRRPKNKNNTNKQQSRGHRLSGSAGGSNDSDEDESRLLSVLPSDAHVRVDEDNDEDTAAGELGGYREEEEMAVAAERAMRRANVEEDFDVAGLSVEAATQAAEQAVAKRRSAHAAALLAQTAPMVEAVERDFAALSTTERVAILRHESPELLTMLDDLKKYLAEVKQVMKPLHELLYERHIPDADRPLVSFLETKVQLMLSYCMHVTFYLLLKVNGQKVSNHPVIDRLVEIRVYLEKMWPLEEKLQYSLHRLLSGKSTVAAGAKLRELRPVQEHMSGVYPVTRTTSAASRNRREEEAKQRRDELRRRREAEELEREEQSAMTRVRTKKATELNTVDVHSTIAPLSYQEDEDQFFSKLTAHRGHLHNHGSGDEDEANPDEDEEDGMQGMTLMERLRRRHAATTAALQQQQQKRQQSDRAQSGDTNNSDTEDCGSEEEADLLSCAEDETDETTSHCRSKRQRTNGGSAEQDHDGENAAIYDALWQEERQRVEDEQLMDEDKAQQRKDKQLSSVVEVDKRKAGKRIESHRGLTKSRPRDRKNPRVAQRRKYERGMRVHKAQSRQHQPEPEGGFAGVQSLKPAIIRSKKFK